MSSITKTFTWKEQLSVGTRGEELFSTHYPYPVTIFPKHKADFRRVSDGALIELKTDDYSLEKTSNFFMERYSDVNKKSAGGPWRARKDRVAVFVYYFVRFNVMLEFNSKELCKVLEKLTKKQGLIYVKNRAWTTAGFKVKILDVFMGLWDEQRKGGAERCLGIHTFDHAGIDGAVEWRKFIRKEVEMAYLECVEKDLPTPAFIADYFKSLTSRKSTDSGRETNS